MDSQRGVSDCWDFSQTAWVIWGQSEGCVRRLGYVRQPGSSGDSQRRVRLLGLVKEVCQTVGIGQTAWVTWEQSEACQSVGIGEAVQVICG